jgi:hypothetical protein
MVVLSHSRQRRGLRQPASAFLPPTFSRMRMVKNQLTHSTLFIGTRYKNSPFRCEQFILSGFDELGGCHIVVRVFSGHL